MIYDAACFFLTYKMMVSLLLTADVLNLLHLR